MSGLYVAVTPAISAWLPTLAALSVGMVCVVVYAAHPTQCKRRLIVALYVAAVCTGALVAADRRIVVPDLCPGLEPYSAQWWMHGCFLP